LNNKKPEQNKRPSLIIYLVFLVILIAGTFLLEKLSDTSTKVSYTSYKEYLTSGSIKEADVKQSKSVPTGTILFKLNVTTAGSTIYSVSVSDVNAEMEALAESQVPFSVTAVQEDSYFMTTLLPVLIIVLGLAFVIMLLTGRMNGAQGGGMMMNFTKSRAQVSDPKSNPIRFGNVAGLIEEKEELAEVVDFLKNPKKYTELGARIPKGVLLVGPPGTGKTLLAKAVAGEAGVPFFTISGSDFVEMFVGVGAGRVRDLFETAKQNAPCIIFIDEIDAVARIRGSGLGGGHDEREQTLNQLLVEMDGFTVNQGIIVMAATNRADILDPAILRPGRFDRKVRVGRPDVRGREEILTVHAKHKELSDEVDLHRVAQTTAGFSGADLENLMNEAAISAAKKNQPFITEKDIESSFVKVGIGQEKRSKLISQKEKEITAYHEMGHAILFEALPQVGPVHTISIIPTGIGAAGYTMPLPENDEMFETKSRMLEEIMVSMGGRIAEEIQFHDVTTGASQDIKQATELARSMVMKYGMSEKIGFINYEQQQDEVFMGRDLGHMKTYGSAVYNEIEEEVKSIMNACYAQAEKMIKDKWDILEQGAKALLEKEKLTQQEFEAIYHGNKENDIL